jgi:mono/diheme cytochrome c family protein
MNMADDQQRPVPGEPIGELPPLLGEPDRTDVNDIHQALVRREREEPREGLEPAPWWVWTISVVVLFAMGFYVGRYSGTFGPHAHELEQPQIGGAAAAEPPPNGAQVFSAICQPCHQDGGVGVEGKYPPLAGSEWVAGDASIPARIVLNGLQGPIQAKGKTIVNEMPAFGNQLNDAEVAAVITYVRSSFGNKAGPADAKLVRELRDRTASLGPWTAERLKATR